MGTPRGAAHRDIEQRFRDIETRLRELFGRRHQTIIYEGDVLDAGNVQDAINELWSKRLRFDREPFTLTAGDITAGEVVVQLPRVPADKSVILTMGGVPQHPAGYTVNNAAATVTIPLAGHEQADDEGWAHYAYETTAEPEPEPDPPLSTLVEFASSGWKYLQVARSAADDYSAEAFDDSGWATGAGPFGVFFGGIGDWPEPATVWDLNTRLWLRKTVAATPSTEAVVTVRIEESVALYWNGSLIGEDSADGGVVTFTIPAGSVLASNVLAIRATDDMVTAGSGGQSYVDVRIVH